MSKTLTLIVRKSVGFAALTCLLTLFAIGCSESNNPMAPAPAPEPEPEPIKTPKSLIVRSITVVDYKSTKSNGNTWDWDPFKKENRRPDIYVQLQRSGRFPVYASNTVNNAKTDTDYKFTKPASVHDGKLPYEVKAGQTWKVYVVDDDFGGNETIGSISFSTKSLYTNDNANSVSRTTKGSGGVKVRIIGDWVY